MRYYSDITKKVYDTEDALNAAEATIKKQKAEKEAKEMKLKNERAARAKVVDAAYQEYIDARKTADKKYRDANKLLNDFIKDYGSYHTSISSNTDDRPLFYDDCFPSVFYTDLLKAFSKYL